MKRTLFLIYGAVVYLLFNLAFIYLIGFVGNFFVPNTIDGAVTMGTLPALLINIGLVLIFAVQHSVMARSAFKEKWTKIIPQEIERSTYVLFSTAALCLLMWFWQPLGGVVWSTDAPVLKAILYALFGLGWAILLLSTFMINHFDLFGLRQVWLAYNKKPYIHLSFKTPFFYKYVRHPLYLGFMIAFWSTPTMTVTHLLLAIGFTLYILKAIDWEEADLIKELGQPYVEYRKKVSKIIPFLGGGKKTVNPDSEPVVEVLSSN
ncbi:MAG: methanethiol S-methyltransferase [Bacteroidota bacterium]